MGKRSNFERVPRDFYPTPKEAVIPLLSHIDYRFFVEPCSGKGDLVRHLTEAGMTCLRYSDITTGQDALEINEKYVGQSEYIITNPPWDRKILHPMIDHFKKLRCTWLLFDADWMHTKQAIPYLKYCSKIVSVGRVKWIPDSKMTGKDNCCWYRFENEETTTEFISR